MATREQWGSRTGFLLAAIGSAIGLGNIWRYPYIAYENGGGAFLIPYFIALLTAGIPILIMEYALGHRYQGGTPYVFKKLSKKWEWLGWWQIVVAFFIVTYYVVIIGWALSFTYFSFGTQWGQNTEAFFFNQYLGDTGAFWEAGGLQWKVLLPVLLIWAVILFVMQKGVRKGIERASKILMPVLILMMVAITIRGVTLPGAVEGLNVLLTPDFSSLVDPNVWIAAYGQVFFSLSIGFGIMITYSSYLPEKSDLANSGMIAALANSGFEFLAALGVFGALGFLAVSQGSSVNEVVNAGVALAFVIFPQIINQFPGPNSLYGVLFFGSLLFAGFTSAVSILEPAIAGVKEKFDLSRRQAVNWVCGLAFLVSLMYTTRGGIRYLDTVDHFINQYGVALAGLVEVIMIAWAVRKLGMIQEHINAVSDIRIGNWWRFCLAVVTPVMVTLMTVFNLMGEWAKPYENYPLSGLIAVGWSVVLVALVLGFVFQKIGWRQSAIGQKEAS
ncbi:neurotransmitter:Na+ symporter, NSS family [Melghirimyces thermohalophilus]|uniref:Neurotransmitter:Na+ symporter, NSS family n=1 Tax=Melghirimyces thermohalophilus TaxID=1236220 RepID=A0A1G6L281_9BACL|nr:sodium-dependent transporter [Melghirimyces thermohalophilus]SDC37450.1 neurotransmitter:Na+ symporter, NSS family [Melghirimyces thermohalophilus]